VTLQSGASRVDALDILLAILGVLSPGIALFNLLPIAVRSV
jgi:hypothetical protein